MGHKIEAVSVATVGLLGHPTPEHLGGIGDQSFVAQWLTAFSCPSQCSQLIVRYGMRKQGSIGTVTISAITPEFRLRIVLGEQGARRAECSAPMA